MSRFGLAVRLGTRLGRTIVRRFDSASVLQSLHWKVVIQVHLNCDLFFHRIKHWPMAHSLVVTDSIVFSSPTRFQSHRKHGVRINEAKDHPTHYVATHLQPPDLTARGLPRDDLSQSSPYLSATHECRTVCCSLDVSPEVQMQTLLTLKCCFTSTETVGLLGTGAQDGHLDFHTAPGTDTDLHGPVYIYTQVHADLPTARLEH